VVTAYSTKHSVARIPVNDAPILQEKEGGTKKFARLTFPLPESGQREKSQTLNHWNVHVAHSPGGKSIEARANIHYSQIPEIINPT